MILSYNLGSTAQQLRIRKLLLAKHSQFYHYTLLDQIDDIKINGLDVEKCNRQMTASYVREPNVMRFCTLEAKSDIVRMRQGSSQEKHHFLSFKAETILNKNYGLDWSSGHVEGMLNNCYKVQKQDDLTDEIVINIIERSGFISCYETIPPEEINFNLPKS